MFRVLHDWCGLFQKRQAGIAGPAVSLDPTHERIWACSSLHQAPAHRRRGSEGSEKQQRTVDLLANLLLRGFL
jgi:hypothetical protein